MHSTSPTSAIERALIRTPLIAAPHDSVIGVITRMGQTAQSEPERGSCALVFNGDQLQGIFTEPITVQLLSNGYDLSHTPVGSVAMPALTYPYSRLCSTEHALQILRDARSRHLIVLDDQEQVMGVLMSALLLDSVKYAELVRHNHDLTQQLTDQVTVLQQQTERLRRSEAHLQSAQRIAALGSWEFETAIQAITWSDEVYRIFGRDPQLGPPSFDELQAMFPPDDRIRHAQTLEHAILYAESYNIELRLYRPNGTMRHIQARGEPVLDLSGRLTRLVGTVLDITERKEAEMQLQATSAQLVAANHELEAFAYSVSHDLRAPLRAIDGFSQALIEDCEEQLDSTARSYLARIRNGARRMSTLIDDLLRLSRVSRTEMQYSWVDLSSEARSILGILRAEHEDRNVDVQIAPNLIIWADHNLIRVALENLLTNAWKFSATRDPARIRLAAKMDAGTLIYSISDNGVGFNPDYSHKLFGVFQRLHDTNEFPGTGIGLATVQRVIHRHGGTIWAKSAIDQGATFYFTLPPGKESRDATPTLDSAG